MKGADAAQVHRFGVSACALGLHRTAERMKSKVQAEVAVPTCGKTAWRLRRHGTCVINAPPPVTLN